jgi:peptidoglycan/xylan/chitin deacetylase (PgdA/CDA1 family)
MTKESKRSDSERAGSSLSRRIFVAAGTAAGAMAVAQASPAGAQSAKTGGHAPFWPNGARLAVTMSMVVETGGDPPPMTKGPDGKNYPDLYATTALQYATNEAIPRMLDMFDRRKIKVTSMVVGKFCEQHPDLVKEIVQRGHECGAHGYTHSIQYNMSRDDEHAFLQSAVDAITKAAGKPPLGYNGRGQLRSANTLSLEQELGFIYHIDDISRDEPFVVPVNGKPFAVVPYTQHLGDIGYFNNRGSAVAFNGEMKYEFDALYAEAATRRRMMVITIHDSIARASRVKAFEDFIAYAQGHKGVWFARADELAHWALASPDSIKETTAT